MNLNDLNPMQRQAAETLKGPLLILAGAGSGKTRTLTYRIANLIEHGVNPRDILALTFTNKAAGEMRDRVAALVGDRTGDMWIGTFHSVCVRMLRRDIEKLGYQRSFTIYDDDDQHRVIKETLRIRNIDEKVLPIREVKAVIGDAKNKMMTADEWFAKSDRDFKAQQIHDVFVLYEQRLRAANALDFDDLLLRALQLLLDHPPVLQFYRDRFEYISVDEYQDTNAVQYALVNLLAQESRNLCVVGDDDQSIYGWRGADIRNILEFEKDFPDAKVIKLEQNYRSDGNILDAANQVIAHNKGRKEKVLWTDAEQGAQIKLYSAGDEREEAAWICEQIRQLNEADLPYSGITVIYRINAQSRVIEEMFMRAAIPYRVFGGTRFYDRREIRDVLAYLRLAINSADDVSLARIINVPKRNIGESTISLLREAAREQGVPLFSVVVMPPDTLSSRPRKCIADFARLMTDLFAHKDSMKLTEYVEYMLDQTGLKAQFEYDASEEGKQRYENLMEFIGAAREFEEKSTDQSLEAFLENVTLVTDLDRQEDAPHYVTLMTMHSAKGLEYDAVFMAGLEEGIFPSLRNLADERRLEEERRLCYVGITRARKRLFVSYARRRMLFNQITHNAPSLFIKEIPARLISDEWAEERRKSFAPENQPVREPARRSDNTNRVVSFGTPGMRQGNHLQIPGVRKGFVESSARAVSATAKLFKQGDRVLHRKFGEGTVESIDGVGADTRIAISFTAYGVKVFALSIAPIIKIEE